MHAAATAEEHHQVYELIAGNSLPPALKASGKMTISCYENDIPEFIENDLLRLYGSIYSSLAQFRIYYRGNDVSTYIVRKNGEIETVFLFTRDADKVRVVNEVFIANEEDIQRFSSYVFSTMPTVNSISFKAIRTDLRQLPYPFQRANHLEDIVVELPATVDAYLASMGGSTRRKIKRSTERLISAFPSFDFKVQLAQEIDEASIRAVIELNHSRMAIKNKLSLIDPRESERMIRFAKECGMLCTVWIDGRLCAGALAFRSGSSYFLNVIAHDTAYDNYWLGTLCCYWAVCQGIERQAKEFHFLWGRYDYKYMLKGVLHELDNLVIYRSRKTMLSHSSSVLSFIARASRRRAQLWLHASQRENKSSARVAYAVLNGFRKVASLVHR